jgi:hypothetical protein
LKIVSLVSLILLGSVFPGLRAQTQSNSNIITTPGPPKPAAWFPHNWIRGHIDFDFAGSHNEPDLGRCAFPQPPSAGGVNSQCTAYARYFLGGYVELQPLNRTFARHIFLFFTPKFSFGNNIPQVKYTYSMEPMAFDRSIGVGLKMPHSLEVRFAQHQVDYLGRYSGNLGPADLHTTGPYGLYSTVGVRWNFGGYGGSSGDNSW